MDVKAEWPHCCQESDSFEGKAPLPFKCLDCFDLSSKSRVPTTNSTNGLVPLQYLGQRQQQQTM